MRKLLLVVISTIFLLALAGLAYADGTFVGAGCSGPTSGIGICRSSFGQTGDCIWRVGQAFCEADTANGCYYVDTSCSSFAVSEDCTNPNTGGLCTWNGGYWRCSSGDCIGSDYSCTGCSGGAGNWCTSLPDEPTCNAQAGSGCVWGPTTCSCAQHSDPTSCSNAGCATFEYDRQCWNDIDNDGVTGAKNCVAEATYLATGCPFNGVIDEFGDNDCNDNDDQYSFVQEWCEDRDRDGYLNETNRAFSCGPPTSDWELCLIPPGTGYDCSDRAPGINPGVAEICGNSIDDNCDGQVDEGCGCLVDSDCNATQCTVNQAQIYDYYCNAGICEINVIDRDDNQSVCEDSTSLNCNALGWDISGEVGAGECCGNDIGTEFYTAEQSDGTISFLNSEYACCDSQTDCVNQNGCFTAGQVHTNQNFGGPDDSAYCEDQGFLGQWVDCDNPPNPTTACSSVCDNSYYNGEAAPLGDFPAGPGGQFGCCGDDFGENHRWGQADGTMDAAVPGAACCSDTTDCIANVGLDSTCFDSGDSALVDADSDGDTDYCAAGTWGDCNPANNDVTGANPDCPGYVPPTLDQCFDALHCEVTFGTTGDYWNDCTLTTDGRVCWYDEYADFCRSRGCDVIDDPDSVGDTEPKCVNPILTTVDPIITSGSRNCGSITDLAQCQAAGPYCSPSVSGGIFPMTCNAGGDCTFANTWYRDADGDLWIDQTNSMVAIVSPGAGWYQDSDPLVLGYDCYDGDANLTWECCNPPTIPAIYDSGLPPSYFIKQKIQYNGTKTFGSDVVANDYPLDNVNLPPTEYYENLDRGACAPLPLHCAFGLTDRISHPLGTGIAFRGLFYNATTEFNETNMYCSYPCDDYGCPWVDPDGDQFVCETEGGWDYIKGGEDIAGGQTIGEYDDAALPIASRNAECCGDDPNELSTTIHCAGSSTSEPSLCCPNDGQQYYIMDGECTLECPDVMKSPPTFIGVAVGSSSYNGYEAVLDGTNGYCCDGSANGSAAGGPLCVDGIPGCYTQLGLPGANDADYGKKYFCSNSIGDDQCVVEACLNGYTYELCEEVTDCTYTVEPVRQDFADRKVLCDTYTKEDPGKQLSPSCDPVLDTDKCEIRTQDVVLGADCKALCLENSAGITNCQEVCESYSSLQTITTYHGNLCTFTPGCELTGVANPVGELDVDNIDVGSCNSFGTCNQFGCSTCGECTAAGCPTGCTEYEETNVVCSTTLNCQTIPCQDGNAGDASSQRDLVCINATSDSGNNQFLRVTGTGYSNTFTCTPEGSIEYGDPLCEYNIVTDDTFNYNPARDYCERGPSVCDTSALVGSTPQVFTENGCNALTTDTDDYWGLYDSDCALTGASTIPNTYGQACCYAFSVGNFDVYDNDVTIDGMSQGIKIY